VKQCQRSLLCWPSISLSEAWRICFEVEGSLNWSFRFLESGVSGDAVEGVGAGETARSHVLGVSSSMLSGISSGSRKPLVVNNNRIGCILSVIDKRAPYEYHLAHTRLDRHISHMLAFFLIEMRWVRN
jgi:hypothetical protein